MQGPLPEWWGCKDYEGSNNEVMSVTEWLRKHSECRGQKLRHRSVPLTAPELHSSCLQSRAGTGCWR